MKIICNGYINCKNAKVCYHSKPHDVVLPEEIGLVYELSCWLPDNNDHNFLCQCSTKSLRKYKLEILNKK